jgi:hypothetical protein
MRSLSISKVPGIGSFHDAFLGRRIERLPPCRRSFRPSHLVSNEYV